MSRNKTTEKTVDKSANKSALTNGNGKKAVSKTENLEASGIEPKSYKSAMKAFEMTHRRLYPELYKNKKKRE